MSKSALVRITVIVPRSYELTDDTMHKILLDAEVAANEKLPTARVHFKQVAEPTTYLVTAYRWGATNNRQYHVYAGPDRDRAFRLAEEEMHDRGGKYDCAIYKFSEDGTEYELEGYVAANCTDTKPYHSWDQDMYEKLGHVLYHYAGGIAYLPDPDHEIKGALKPVVVEPPQWLVDEVQRAKEFAAAMNKREAPAVEDEERELDNKLADILHRTAIALKGPEPKLQRWSWHDLPEVAQKLVEEKTTVTDTAIRLLGGELCPEHAKEAKSMVFDEFTAAFGGRCLRCAVLRMEAQK